MVAAALTQAVIAATRFGFAPRAGELTSIAQDPEGWVLRQLDQRPLALGGDLPQSAPMVAAMLEARRDKRDQDPDAKRKLNQQLRAVYLAEIAARIERGLDHRGAALGTADAVLEQSFHRLDAFAR